MDQRNQSCANFGVGSAGGAEWGNLFDNRGRPVGAQAAETQWRNWRPPTHRIWATSRLKNAIRLEKETQGPRRRGPPSPTTVVAATSGRRVPKVEQYWNEFFHPTAVPTSVVATEPPRNRSPPRPRTRHVVFVSRVRTGPRPMVPLATRRATPNETAVPGTPSSGPIVRDRGVNKEKKRGLASAKCENAIGQVSKRRGPGTSGPIRNRGLRCVDGGASLAALSVPGCAGGCGYQVPVPGPSR